MTLDRYAPPACADVPSTPCSHWLAVRDGHTADRLRPLVAGRILVGAGSNCHVQIASHEVAMVHAVLTRVCRLDDESDSWQLEALCSEPAVLVNGEPVRSRLLQHDDLIGLAGVNLALIDRRCLRSGDDREAAPATVDFTDAADELDELQPDAMAPAAMSAEELVDAIEADLSMIDELTRENDNPFGLPLEREIPMPTTGRDPHRVRGLATLLRAAEEFETNGPSTIPLVDPDRAADQSRRIVTPRKAA